ncbi:regulatory protein RecX [Lawsonibacter sp. LCP25S3_G6]|uniref:regulatory protein RecX n=1 Tax=unclassified Lawsonibacter TaxID=2617946 RepID=UPI003F9ABB42
MVIQELKPSKHVEGRWLAVLEDGSILRLGEGEVVRFALYAGKQLSDQEAEELQRAAKGSALKEKALSLLSRKPQSRRELERKLGEWGAMEQESAAICDRLEELGYLNDAAYAGMVARHYSAKGYGERKLRDEFYRRGIPRQLWEEALAESQDPRQAIDHFLAKKLSGREGDRQALKKASDALARRGYRWSDINEGLRRYGAVLDD